LLAANLDYWALGHVHTQKVLKNGHPFIAYPGTPQGRNIRESGPRGCLLVRVDGTGEVSARFEPVDTVRWYSHELPIDDFEGEGELLEALEKVCEKTFSAAQERMSILRVILRGRGQLHSVLRRTQVVEDLTDRLRAIGLESVPPVWIERIVVNTSTAIDLDFRRQSADFLGEILRVIDASRREPKELYELISQLYEDRRGRRFLKTPAETDLLEILEEVESMCLDELVQEESS
jgi:DNA repair exonuclease SbcCD nuclease subunit